MKAESSVLKLGFEVKIELWFKNRVQNLSVSERRSHKRFGLRLTPVFLSNLVNTVITRLKVTRVNLTQERKWTKMASFL